MSLSIHWISGTSKSRISLPTDVQISLYPGKPHLLTLQQIILAIHLHSELVQRVRNKALTLSVPYRENSFTPMLWVWFTFGAISSKKMFTVILKSYSLTYLSIRLPSSVSASVHCLSFQDNQAKSLQNHWLYSHRNVCTTSVLASRFS